MGYEKDEKVLLTKDENHPHPVSLCCSQDCFLLASSDCAFELLLNPSVCRAETQPRFCQSSLQKSFRGGRERERENRKRESRVCSHEGVACAVLGRQLRLFVCLFSLSFTSLYIVVLPWNSMWCKWCNDFDIVISSSHFFSPVFLFCGLLGASFFWFFWLGVWESECFSLRKRDISPGLWNQEGETFLGVGFLAEQWRSFARIILFSNCKHKNHEMKLSLWRFLRNSNARPLFFSSKKIRKDAFRAQKRRRPCLEICHFEVPCGSIFSWNERTHFSKNSDSGQRRGEGSFYVFNDFGWFEMCNTCRVFDEETGDAAAIDPVWPDQVLQAAQLNGAKVKMVLTTHHHW